MRKVKFVSVFVLLALLLNAGPGAAMIQSPPPAKVQQSPPISIRVDGQTIFLERGRNVHPQTYALLLQDPDFASREDVKWVFVDDLWVPLKRTEERPLREAPAPEKTSPPSPLYNPECRITLNVPVESQKDSGWAEDYLFENPSYCGKMKRWGCAITSAAMVFEYYGTNTDPGELNVCAGKNGYHCYADCDGNGYDPCCLVWGCAADHCSDNEAGFVRYYDFYWPALCGLLSEDRPPIVDVGGHFVVVYRSLGYGDHAWSYFINDPLDGSTYKRLSYYTNNPVMIAEYYNK